MCLCSASSSLNRGCVSACRLATKTRQRPPFLPPGCLSRVRLSGVREDRALDVAVLLTNRDSVFGTMGLQRPDVSDHHGPCSSCPACHKCRPDEPHLPLFLLAGVRGAVRGAACVCGRQQPGHPGAHPSGQHQGTHSQTPQPPVIRHEARCDVVAVAVVAGR